MRWLLLSGATAVACLLGAIPLGRAPRSEPGVPEISGDSGYVGSSACRACHPAEFSSWHQTYHRTMTRRSSVVWSSPDAPELPAQLADGPLGYQVEQIADGSVWAIGPDIHVLARLLNRAKANPPGSSRSDLIAKLLEQVPEVRRELVMVTGSHHYLAFWLEAGNVAELRQFPFVFLLRGRTWAPREEVFLKPPESLPHIARWNANCIQCHAVAGQPRQSETTDAGVTQARYDSQVAELGIACEACHGPGEEHVAAYQNPLTRYAALDQESEPAGAVRNPTRLSASQEVAVCGQCHSYFTVNDPDAWWQSGFVGLFTPGRSLEDSRTLLRPDPAQLRQASLSQAVESIFWSDGTIRVGGRETNGLLESPCFQHASEERRVRCSSCHSLHAGSRDDQLSQAVLQNQDEACLSCHADTPAHSGHPPDSPGSRCVSCHMPKTSYALLKAIASHRITSPSHRLTDPPSACVLCHVDRSESWHHLQLGRLFPDLREPRDLSVRPSSDSTALAPPPGSVDEEIPFAVRRALSADAAERAIFAAHFSLPETLETVSTKWPAAALSTLTQDPYHAVRRIAEDSLNRLSERQPLPTVPEELARKLEKFHELRDASPVVISE